MNGRAKRIMNQVQSERYAERRKGARARGWHHTLHGEAGRALAAKMEARIWTFCPFMS